MRFLNQQERWRTMKTLDELENELGTERYAKALGAVSSLLVNRPPSIPGGLSMAELEELKKTGGVEALCVLAAWMMHRLEGDDK